MDIREHYLTWLSERYRRGKLNGNSDAFHAAIVRILPVPKLGLGKRYSDSVVKKRPKPMPRSSFMSRAVELLRRHPDYAEVPQAKIETKLDAELREFVKLGIVRERILPGQKGYYLVKPA